MLRQGFALASGQCTRGHCCLDAPHPSALYRKNVLCDTYADRWLEIKVRLFGSLYFVNGLVFLEDALHLSGGSTGSSLG